MTNVINKTFSNVFVANKIKIIDIRTQMEWEETGVLKGSYTISFFDENGSYDLTEFKKNIDTFIAKGEEFAVLCKSGYRSAILASLLSKENYNVINIEGGILDILSKNFDLIKYE